MEVGINWILEIQNMGIFAEVLVISRNTLKIHKEYAEHVITLLNIKE